jgi:uncharacterized OsmC-like protein
MSDYQNMMNIKEIFKMNKEEANKKSGTVKKIGIGIGIVVALVVVAASFYWFSMPKEARNMMTFMVFGSKEYDAYEEYQVIERNEEAIHPSGYNINLTETDANKNSVKIGTATEMVKNNTSSMLKKGSFQTVGIDGYTGWKVLADEGAAEGTNPYGPSPLSYYTAGVASNLHTQITRIAELEGVVLKNVRVEVANDFRWDDMLAPDGTGYLDLTTVKIIIESDSSEEEIQRIKEMAINEWAVGEALMNKTSVVPNLMINGDDWEYYNATPGTAKSDQSYDGDMKLSSVTDVPLLPEYIELANVEEEGSIIDMTAMSNMSFQIYAISESLDNPDRPYLKKITISTPTEETWEIYSDEFLGENDKPLAPTSLEYFTIGTSLCLTSQTTLVSAMMGLDFTDYRVEHLFEYIQDEANTGDMMNALDTVQTYVFIKSDEDKETLETFFNKSLALCFAGEGLVNETDMDISVYLNGNEIN